MNSLAFITYIAAAFIVLLGIALAILLISHKENRSSRRFRAVTLFAAAVFAYCVLYFIFYFRDVMLQDYSIGLPLRVIDYLLDACLIFFWLRVLGELLPAGSGLARWAWICGLSRAMVGVAAACFMNPYYGFARPAAGMAFVVCESAVTLLTILPTVYYTLRLIQTVPTRLPRQYAGFVTAVLCLWDITQQIVNGCLYTGRFVSAWAAGIPDSTAFAFFLMGLATFVFLFREDFSPLFYAIPEAGPDQPLEEPEARPAPEDAADVSSDSEEPEAPAPSDLLAQAAMQHGLTVRELEVLRLVYEGRNNPEIAEALFISRNTVKKHLQNIYEKTGVGSRMELIYVITRGK